MESRIIVVNDNEITEEDVWAVFNKKCEEAVSSEEKYIAIFLRPELGSGVPLLDWLEKWQVKCQKSNKFLYVISDNKQQLESMELSSLDQNLNYFSSINEFEDHTRDSAAGLEQEEEVLTVAGTEEQIDRKEISFPNIKDVPQTISLVVGDTVKISGEYICQGCGVGRMWMKGKEITACPNPECFEPSKGWKLDFDLF